MRTPVIGDSTGQATGEAGCSARPNSPCVSCPFFRGQGHVSLAPQAGSPASEEGPLAMTDDRTLTDALVAS